MQENNTDMIKVMPKVTSQLEKVAQEMNAKNEDEREVVIDGTSGKLWLVRAGSQAAKNRQEQKASILTNDLIVVGEEKFFLARR